jgi:hypothetical protein
LLGVWDLLVLFWGYEIGFLIILNLPVEGAVVGILATG